MATNNAKQIERKEDRSFNYQKLLIFMKKLQLYNLVHP